MKTDVNTFTHDGVEYDLTKVRILARSEKSFFLKVADLTWVLKYDQPDEERVDKAKLRWPLFVTKYRGRWCVIDGLHRLERCRRLGIKMVEVKNISKDVLDRCKL